jgi:outer membrane protein W
VNFKLAAGLWIAGACMAQQGWEIGAGAGYGGYRNGSIGSPNGTAQAGIRNSRVFTGVVNQDMSDRFSGEVRYVHQSGETFLASGSAKGEVTAESHTVHYDIQVHFAPRDHALRPFVAAGIGAKFYQATGPTPVPQPLPRIAGLTSESQWRPVYVFGGGVKLRVREHLVLRADIRDYVTDFPGKLFSLTAGAVTHGVFQQVTPMVGVGYSF